MKKFIVCALIVLIIFPFSVFAGGGRDRDDAGKPRIAVSLPPAVNAWQVRMREVIDDSVARHPEYSWTVRNAVDDNDQLNQLTVFRNDRYDAMIILPGNGTLLTPICEAIFDDGTKTIILDRNIESTKYTALVMGDNFGAGVNAAHVIGQRLGGRGDIAYLRSYMGIPIDMERSGGFTSTLAREYPGIRILVEGDGEFNRDAGLRAMNNILPAYPRLDALVTHDDEAALGALAAIENARRTDIRFIIGMGGTRVAYERFLANDPVYVASMSYFPSMGADAVEMAVRILRGGTYPRDTIIRSMVVDSSNVREFMSDAY